MHLYKVNKHTEVVKEMGYYDTELKIFTTIKFKHVLQL